MNPKIIPPTRSPTASDRYLGLNPSVPIPKKLSRAVFSEGILSLSASVTPPKIKATKMTLTSIIRGRLNGQFSTSLMIPNGTRNALPITYAAIVNASPRPTRTPRIRSTG